MLDHRRILLQMPRQCCKCLLVDALVSANMNGGFMNFLGLLTASGHVVEQLTTMAHATVYGMTLKAAAQDFGIFRNVVRRNQQ